MRRRRRIPIALALLGFVGCASYRLPYTQPPGANEPTDAHRATLVFLWPSTSCDPAGYFTLATSDGEFLGNISRGSRLSVPVPAGERTIVAWNDVVEAASGWMKTATVPVLHADLREGRTYYVRMMLGEWDERGPVVRWYRSSKGRIPVRRCAAVTESTTSAMAVLSPGSEGWHDVPEWMAALDTIVPDRAAGQAWLDQNRASLDAHVAVAQDRFLALRPRARMLATIEPADGAPR
jgi:hypothetical protein